MFSRLLLIDLFWLTLTKTPCNKLVTIHSEWQYIDCDWFILNDSISTAIDSMKVPVSRTDYKVSWQTIKSELNWLTFAYGNVWWNIDNTKVICMVTDWPKKRGYKSLHITTTHRVFHFLTNTPTPLKRLGPCWKVICIFPSSHDHHWTLTEIRRRKVYMFNMNKTISSGRKFLSYVAWAFHPDGIVFASAERFPHGRKVVIIWRKTINYI